MENEAKPDGSADLAIGLGVFYRAG